jgi:hypothetical protein
LTLIVSLYTSLPRMGDFPSGRTAFVDDPVTTVAAALCPGTFSWSEATLWQTVQGLLGGVSETLTISVDELDQN